MEIVDYGTYFKRHKHQYVFIWVQHWLVCHLNRGRQYVCLLRSGVNQNDTMTHCHAYAHDLIVKLFLNGIYNKHDLCI